MIGEYIEIEIKVGILVVKVKSIDWSIVYDYCGYIQKSILRFQIVLISYQFIDYTVEKQSWSLNYQILSIHLSYIYWIYIYPFECEQTNN